MSGFEGMADLISDLGAFNSRVMPEAIAPALTDTGNFVVTQAKANTPVLSGDLRDSIRIFTNEVQGTYARLALGSTLVYARQVEDGGSRNAARHMIGSAVAKAPEQFEPRLNYYLEQLLASLNL